MTFTCGRASRCLLNSPGFTLAYLFDWDEADRHDPLAGLTGRERKILELIGDGLTNRQIGERLSVSVKTVKNYVSVLFVKLGMKQRTQAAAYAARVFDGRTFERPASSTTGPGCLNEVGKEDLDFPLGGMASSHLRTGIVAHCYIHLVDNWTSAAFQPCCGLSRLADSGRVP